MHAILVFDVALPLDGLLANLQVEVSVVGSNWTEHLKTGTTIQHQRVQKLQTTSARKGGGGELVIVKYNVPTKCN